MPSGMPDLKQIPDLLISGICLFVLVLCGCTVDPVETDLLLPVDFSNVPDDMVLTSFHTDKIEVRIKGDPRRIEVLNKETVIYPADLYTDLEFDPAGDSDSIEPGHYLLPVDRTRIPLDPSITVLDLSPSYLSVRLEKKVTKVFKVNVPYTGEAAKGYMALAPSCEPSTVALTGAESLINEIDQLQTKPVDLGEANENFKKEVPLDLDNPLLFTPANSMFIVSVSIQPMTGTRTIADIPIELKNSPANVSIEPASISVDLKGPQEHLSNTAVTDKIHAFMDLKGLKSGVYARHAYIDIPLELVMTNASPQVFTVKIE
ncbi:MAG: CdaR family protein [Desulfobacterales bacterium]|nr:CdaR family protein [Desulfobacterales bacterium]